VSATFVEGDLSEELARALGTASCVAVDTETSGLEWATDRLQLCQLFTPETGAVLLRGVSGRPERLASVLEDPAVLKIFHYAPFDLRFLEGRWGVRVAAVGCTKTASRLLNPGLASAEHSLSALLSRHLDLTITKGAVRTSDWGAGRLTDTQVAYAMADVAHLIDLHTVLASQLKTLQLWDLYEQVCAYLPVDAHLEVSGIPNPLLY
jgi:ribonuclease D